MSDLIPCPIRGCTRKRRPLHVMCRQHWWLVPKGMRQTVWQLFHEARGTDQHLLAIQAACDEVERHEADANQDPDPGARKDGSQ